MARPSLPSLSPSPTRRSPAAVAGRVPVVLLAAAALLASPATAQEPNFGRDVVLAGDELLVGQPVNWYGPGAVYVYDRAGEGWAQRQMLFAPDSSRMDDFGRVLARDGNTLVVGAPRKRDGSGVAYTFRRAGPMAPWTPAGTLEPPRDDDHTEFASALHLSGDDLLVGSPAASETGVVYHLRRDGDGWALAQVIRPEPEAGLTGFGVRLDRAGDRLLVGAPASDDGSGRVYAVSLGADGRWSAPRRVELGPGAGARRASTGAAVVVDGERAFVSAPGADAVFALAVDASGEWTVAATLSPWDGAPRAGFGAGLTTAGDELWVGAPGVDGRNGRVYRFATDDSGRWTRVALVEPDVTDGTSWPLGFGYALDVDGDRAAVAMPTRDFGEGRVMTLSRDGDGWTMETLLQGEIYRIGGELASGEVCQGGAMGAFPCTNMEMVAHMSVDDLGGERGVWVNDVWGWTDPETGRRYALVARRDGASFVDVTDAATPRLVGNLPRTDGARPSVWRDIKVIGTTAYVVSDGAGQHGMQVFDLTRLRDVAPGEAPVFEPDYTYEEMASAHNVVADTESGFLYIVGANSGGRTCGGGLHMVDARDPLNPVFAGCYNDPTSPNSRGYTHDAQCMVYRGPDEDYRGRQICVGSNESEMNIADVTDKSNPVTVARMSYPNVAYAHQGWFDPEQRYFYMNDEGDETAGLADRTRTMVWDLTELDEPVLVKEHFGTTPSSDHNLFIVGDRMYQSNYGSGLRVLDISDRENPREIAFFDSAPYNDNGPGFSSTQSGAWSNYPFFEDGLVIFTSVREGLFIMRVRPPVS